MLSSFSRLRAEDAHPLSSGIRLIVLLYCTRRDVGLRNPTMAQTIAAAHGGGDKGL